MWIIAILEIIILIVVCVVLLILLYKWWRDRNPYVDEIYKEIFIYQSDNDKTPHTKKVTYKREYKNGTITYITKTI